VQWTPEQKEQERQAKECGGRRVYLQLTPDQKKTYHEAVEQELAGKDANIAHVRKIKAAGEQPGFFLHSAF
jgi:hypothetical protein